MTSQNQSTGAKAVKKDSPVTDQMVERFLGWKLPDNFHPDAGISFDAEKCRAGGYWPHGTCLLDAHQARAMLEHVLTPVKPEGSTILATIQITKSDDGEVNATFSTVSGMPHDDVPATREVLIDMCEELNVRVMKRLAQDAYQKGYRAAEEAMDE